MSSVRKYSQFVSKLSFGALMLAINAAYAAKPVDLGKNAIPLAVSPPHALAAGSANPDSIWIESSFVDKKQVTHVKIKQTFAGVPVWGADAAIHLPKDKKRVTLAAHNVKSLIDQVNSDPAIQKNGVFYSDIAKELSSSDTNSLQSENAKQAAILSVKQEIEKSPAYHAQQWSLSDEKATLFVYNDQNDKARFVYLVSMRAKAANKIPQQPTAIVDAKTREVLDAWDDIKHDVDAVNVNAVGKGGNPLTGAWQYGSDKPALSITRDSKSKTCYMKNSHVEVRHLTQVGDEDVRDDGVVSFSCAQPVSESSTNYPIPNIYEINGGYSPVNDALHYGVLIKQLYKNWYNSEVLYHIDSRNEQVKTGFPLQMNLLYLDLSTDFGRDYSENAFWDSNSQTMNFGLGSDYWYPTVTLGIAAHEVSHGFTDMDGNANLVYAGQSGALNESFSDMAAAVISYYDSGEKSTDWLLGWEVFKENTGKKKEDMVALRYFDQPEKDKVIGGLSIGSAANYSALEKSCEPPKRITDPFERKQRKNSCIVHYASGVFNKAYYLLSTAEGWTPKSAFEVMVAAQQNKHWLATSNFQQAACGVKAAAYDVSAFSKQKIDKDLTAVFNKVGISLSRC